ncbi:MAG: glutaredoxin family protein [Gallionella sp.]|nr:glutaredoxin family protein [Gallionella sp.]
MKRIVLLLSCLAVMPSGVQAGELYRWLDAKGKVHYGDVPPVDATQVEPRKFPGAAIPGEDLPYETRRAQQNFPVILYVADNCAEACNQARELLKKRGIPFSEKPLITQEDIDAFKAISGSDSVPTLAVGKAFLKGFLAEQWHGELDIAGYPKTAPYRPLGALPASAPAATSEVAPANPATQ